MGKYTILDDPASDRAVQDVLNMVVDGVVDLMGRHVKAIVLMGGYGRGEGGVYKDDIDGFKLVNDLDLAVFVEKDFKKVKKRYNARLKELTVKLQPKARGIKQIDVDITNSHRYRLVPNLVSYYEIKQGHQVLYGSLNLYKIMPSLKAENLHVFDGSIYFYSRGSGLLLPALYFMTDNLREKEIRENFQIELQKACQAMGDALLLKAGRYHFSYRERLRRFISFSWQNRIVPEFLHEKVLPFYKWGVERKLIPEFKWLSDDEMIQRWFEIRDLLGEFFLWFESRRLGTNFENWMGYSRYVQRKGIQEPWNVQVREIVKQAFQFKKLITKTKKSKLLPIMPLLLFCLEPNGCNEGYLTRARNLLSNGKNDQISFDWTSLVKTYLTRYHPGGVVAKAIRL
jgi:hypothetical protein